MEDLTLGIREKPQVNVPTVEQVLTRNFIIAPKYKFTSALLAEDSPLASIIDKARQAPRYIYLADQVTDQQSNATLDILTRATGRPIASFLAVPSQIGEELIDPELQQYYVRQLEQVIRAFEDQGYLPVQLKDLISSKLFRLSQLKVVKGPVSGFTYRNVILPDSLVPMEISPQHVEANTNRVRNFIHDAGLKEKLTQEDIKNLGAQTALAHEYGHVIDSGLLLLLSANTLSSHFPYIELEGKNMNPDANKRVWEVVSLKTDELMATTSNRDQVKRIGLAESEVWDTLTEGLGVSAELAFLDAYTKQHGWVKADRTSLFNSIHNSYLKMIEDYQYFTQLIANQGLEGGNGMFQNYNRFNWIRGAVEVALRDRGYFIGDMLTSEPTGKAFGYYLPIYPEDYKKYVHSFMQAA